MKLLEIPSKAVVCRAGGTIGMINFTPEGRGGDFFRLLAPYAPPPPPHALPPLMSGNEEHVRKLFGPRVESLEMTRREYVESAASPRAYLDLFKQTFRPMVAIYASLADKPERAAALDRDFLDFVGRSNRSTPQAPCRFLTNICSSRPASAGRCATRVRPLVAARRCS
jgi:hypothetical protein